MRWSPHPHRSIFDPNLRLDVKRHATRPESVFVSLYDVTVDCYSFGYLAAGYDSAGNEALAVMSALEMYADRCHDR